MKFLYLFIDFFTILVPVVFSFHPKIKFYKTWKEFFAASIIVAIPFIIWDAVFTETGVWNFDSTYLLGIYIFKLPLEEILFFICIPFSCIFTFYCLTKFYELRWSEKNEKIFVNILFVLLMAGAIAFADRLYTSITFITTGFVCVFLKYIFRVTWFGKAVTVYAILLIPFLIVNGILTGSGLPQPVVNYAQTEIMNIRFFTIPLEDVFYGFELFLLNLAFYKWFLKIKRRKLHSNKTIPAFG